MKQCGFLWVFAETNNIVEVNDLILHLFQGAEQSTSLTVISDDSKIYYIGSRTKHVTKQDVWIVSFLLQCRQS